MAAKTDPVCGQTIDPLRARAVAIVNGERYYFCSVEHRDRFKDDPSRYLGTPAEELPLEESAPVAAPSPPPPPPPNPTPEPLAAGSTSPLALGSTPPLAPTRALRLEIGGMTGPADVERVRQVIARLSGVHSVDVDLVTELAVVELSETSALDSVALEEAISAAGYEATPRDALSAPDLAAIAARSRALLGNAGLAAALAAIALGLTLAGARGALGWIALVLAAGTLAIPGRSLVLAALADLRRRAAGVPLLASLGALAAIVLGVSQLLRSGHADAAGPAALLVAFALLGQWIEARAHRGAGAAIAELDRADPDRARRLRRSPDPGQKLHSEMVPAGELAPGDLVRVAAGEAIPVDGLIRQGTAIVDESLVSSSGAATRAAGDPVVAGTLVTSGTIVVEVRRAGRDSAVARLRAAVAEARGSRTPLARLAERAARWLAPAAIVAAVAVLLVRRIVLEHSIDDALSAAIAVLAAASPAALALAIPIPLAIATARAARRGILFRNAEALERAYDVSTVIVDRAGTLTELRPRVEAHLAVPGGDAGRVLALAAAAERAVDSPLARAVRAYAEAQGVLVPPLDRGTLTAGMGVSATVAGEAVVVGSRKLLEREGVALDGIESLAAPGPSPRSLLFVAVSGRLAGAVAVHDPVRPSARSAVAELRRAGYHVVLLSGDGSAVAGAVAQEAGIDEVHADLRPDEKKHALARLGRPGSAVAAVGDAVDDAPVLAAADVGIALGRGADLALEAGSINVLHGDLDGVLAALALARRAVGGMRLGLGWALVYHAGMILSVAALPLGAAAPAVAAAGAAASTALAVLMSLRLRRA